MSTLVFDNIGFVLRTIRKNMYVAVCLAVLFPFNAFSDQAEQQDYRLLVLGDSLSAAYGLTQQQGWVHLLQNQWQQEGYPVTVINAAISGDTTDGGLARLPRLLDLHEPTHVLIELGGNDALQGHNPTKIETNLNNMVELVQSGGAKALLQAMQIPTNYGRRYTSMFIQVFEDVAQRNNVPLIPFFLEDIALDPNLMQTDGIHPTAEAQPKIMQFLKPHLETHIQATN